MKLTHYGHACVLMELPGDGGVIRLLFDPGAYSREFEDQVGIDAVLLTHAHPDHVDAERLGTLLAANPQAELVLNAHTRTALAGLLDIAPSRTRIVGPEDTFVLRGVSVEVVGGDHACIHAALPTVPNNGYIIDGSLLHPGDALDVAPGPVEVLLLPVGGPWMKIGEAIDYLRTTAPRLAVPIHQAGLALVHQKMHYGLLRDLAPEGTEITVLEHGVPQDVRDAAVSSSHNEGDRR
ncbi:MBL fold metallo-hydrolase [Streptomyces sp. NPDC087844]|uniref:MBL fold metallo-hydrolase n=1 Tax=Streptomyces sp. NPDC087844 TaxID=3365805 RepID=UPI0037FF6941